MTAITKGLAAAAMQAAIYAKLTDAGATALAALVGTRIYDALPIGVLDSYVVIGGISESSDDTLEDGDAGIGSDALFTIDAVTDDEKAGAGFKTVQQIASEIKILLHGNPLTITGWTTVTVEHEDTQFLDDQDEAGRRKRHSSSTYRVIAEAA